MGGLVRKVEPFSTVLTTFADSCRMHNGKEEYSVTDKALDLSLDLF